MNLRRYRLWGRGDDLVSVYRVARWCVGGMIVVLLTLVYPVLLYTLGSEDALDRYQHGVGPWLYIARFLILTVVVVAGVWIVHTLSVLAERAQVYKGMIEKGLISKRKVQVNEPRFGSVGIVHTKDKG